ncbi:MAG: hypothetical protein U0271_38120 [Polyangiaceae bacterium]
MRSSSTQAEAKRPLASTSSSRASRAGSYAESRASGRRCTRRSNAESAHLVDAAGVRVEKLRLEARPAKPRRRAEAIDGREDAAPLVRSRA